jgi:hypothetical protein
MLPKTILRGKSVLKLVDGIGTLALPDLEERLFVVLGPRH